MKFVIVVCVGFSSLVFADAAIEMQEGSIEHWIEYYERERRYYRGESQAEDHQVTDIDAGATKENKK